LTGSPAVVSGVNGLAVMVADGIGSASPALVVAVASAVLAEPGCSDSSITSPAGVQGEGDHACQDQQPAAVA
jgi:hypothetical protein